MRWPGLTLGIVEFSNDPKALMITSAEITDPRWNALSPFKLGRSTAAAQRLLGQPAANDPALRRAYGSEADSVQVDSEAGRVVRVTYQCYSG